MVPAIISDGERNELTHLHWGLIPFWAKDKKIGYHMINARVETLAEKSAFKVPLQRKRCIIPADGFYEWKEEKEGKQPFRFTLKEMRLYPVTKVVGNVKNDTQDLIKDIS